MTEEELKGITPNNTMVYAVRDGVGYIATDVTEDGMYTICGKPFPLDAHIMRTCFELTPEMAKLTRITQKL